MAIDLANLPNKTALTLAGTDQIFVNSGGVASDVSVSALTAYVGAAVQPAIDALESDLAAPTGASLVGYMPAGVGAVATDVQTALNGLAAQLITQGADTHLVKTRALRKFQGLTGYVDRAAVKIMTISDSIFEGYNMTAVIGTPVSQDLPMRKLQSLLNGKYGLTNRAAQYYPTQPGISVVSVTPPADWPVVASGGTVVGNSFGLGARSRLMAPGNTLTFNFTTLAANAQVDFYFVKYSGSGVFRWTLDGSANAAIATTNGTLVDMSKASIPITTAGAHSIVISIDSGGVYFCGFMLLESADKTSGFHLFEGGHAGASTNLFTDTSGGSGNYLDDWFTAIQPNLLILELGANDYTGINPPNSKAAYKAKLKIIIDSCQANVTAEHSILICCTWKLGVTFTPVAVWDDYRQAMIELANEEGCGFIDLSNVVRSDTDATTTNNGFMLSDTTHLSVGGSKTIAKYLADVL